MSEKFPLPDWEGLGDQLNTTEDALASIMDALDGDNDSQRTIAVAGLALTALLLEKNRKYGNSVKDPLSVFSSLSAKERVAVRMDDKLSRIARGDNTSDNEDAKVDLAGYLLLSLTL